MNMNINSSAGILPISRNEHGDVVFLLGKDSRDGVFSDFGGKAEVIDNGDPVNTATREFYEETLGCLCNSPFHSRARQEDVCFGKRNYQEGKRLQYVYDRSTIYSRPASSL